MKTIFLDFGNVVACFDHMRAVRPLTAYTSLSADELFRVLYQGPLEDSYEHGFLSTDEYVNEAKTRGKLTCSSEQFLTAFVDIFTPNPDVIGLIPSLAKNYRLVLASNTNAAHCAKFRIQFVDVLSHFAARVLSFEAGSRKPSEGFFAFAQNSAMAEPAECLFIDDVEENVVAGRRHGWQAVQYKAGDVLADKLRAIGVRVE